MQFLRTVFGFPAKEKGQFHQLSARLEKGLVDARFLYTKRGVI
jgi:hypothetical protein